MKQVIRIASSGVRLRQRQTLALPNCLCFATGENCGILHAGSDAKICAETKPENEGTI